MTGVQTCALPIYKVLLILFCLRGGRRIDMSWENGRPVSVTLYASEDTDSVFCWKDREMKIFCPAGKSVEFKF